MKTRTSVLLVIALVVVGVVAGGIVRSATAQGPKAKEPPHLITVSGTASVSTAPDEAVISLAVHTQNADSATAFQENSAKMAKVMAALADAGIAKADIVTTNISLNQHTQNAGTPREVKFFSAENRADVTIRDMSSIGTVIDKAVAAGASSVQSIRYQLSNPDAARQKALDKAVQNAQTKAEAMAKTAGATLGGIITVREESNPYERNYVRAQAMYAGYGVSATPITPEEVQTQVTVTATWALNG